MTDVLICGANGKMGRVVADIVSHTEGCEVVAGIDKAPELPSHFPVFTAFDDVKYNIDVIIDFSHPSLLDSLLNFAVKNKIPAVIATTGYTDDDRKKIENAAKQIPIFFTYNMSLGINLLVELAKTAATILGNGFDIEIIEKHHNQKLDAPSGTAYMLADALNSVFNDKMEYEFDRHLKREKRPKNQIGIHAVRGGTIVGEHDIIFAGRDEVITLSHSAASKEVFAAGAVKAALFLKDKAPGIYDMSMIIKSL